MKKCLSLLAALFLITGCTTTGGKWTIPDDIKQMSKEQIEGARAYLTSVDGLKYDKQKFDIYVVKVKGIKKVNGFWCWVSTYSGHLVAGLCFSSPGKAVIQVGCNPVTGGEVLPFVIKHESGHAWREGCYGDGTHAGIYSKGFFGWNPSADVVTSVKIWSGENVIIPTIIKLNSGMTVIEDGPFKTQ